MAHPFIANTINTLSYPSSQQRPLISPQRLNRNETVGCMLLTILSHYIARHLRMVEEERVERERVQKEELKVKMQRERDVEGVKSGGTGAGNGTGTITGNSGDNNKAAAGAAVGAGVNSSGSGVVGGTAGTTTNTVVGGRVEGISTPGTGSTTNIPPPLSTRQNASSNSLKSMLAAVNNGQLSFADNPVAHLLDLPVTLIHIIMHYTLYLPYLPLSPMPQLYLSITLSNL